MSEYISELVINLNIRHLATSVSSVKSCSVFVHVSDTPIPIYRSQVSVHHLSRYIHSITVFLSLISL
jgi:hypothetical protein